MIWKGITKPVGFGKDLRTTTNLKDKDRSQNDSKKAAALRGRLLSKFILITN